MKPRSIILLLLAFVPGCVIPQPPPTTAPASQPTTQSSPTPVDPVAPAPAADPKAQPKVQRIAKADDPMVIIRPQVSLAVYHLAVPAGTVSRQDAFWKKVDETAIDLSTRDILQRNGLRVGLAPTASIDEFLAILNKGPLQARPAMFIAHSVRSIELPMKDEVLEQTIAWFDSRNELATRTFDRCENLFVLEFQPAPRKAGDVRLGLCPMVRGLRKKLVAVGDAANREIEIVAPERVYDLNLRLDLPVESFLIVAPSPEAHWKMSLGHAFLMADGNVEKLEQIILIVPQALIKRTP